MFEKLFAAILGLHHMLVEGLTLMPSVFWKAFIGFWTVIGVMIAIHTKLWLWAGELLAYGIQFVEQGLGIAEATADATRVQQLSGPLSYTMGFMNTFAPVEETFFICMLLAGLMVALWVYRLCKSYIPTIA